MVHTKSSSPAKPLAVDGVDFHWLEGTPTSNTHTSEFGVPWAQGEVYKSTSFALSTTDSNGKTSNVPVQSWPLAYWPDGSLKWSGHSIPPNAPFGDTYHLSIATPSEPNDAVSVIKGSDTITVATGAFTCIINTSSGASNIISCIQLNGESKGVDGKLILQVQDRPDDADDFTTPTNTFEAIGQVDNATVEQDGPIRAVVKITGKYHPQNSSRGPLLPFILRVIVGAGGTEARLVHVFILDDSIDIQKDFIKGLGFTFGVPLVTSEPLWDRHVRFASDDGGLWGEAANIISGLRRDPLAPVTSAQFNGTPCPPSSTWPTSMTPYLSTLPLWNDFSLNQLDSDTFSIWKRTTSASRWLKYAGLGTRAAGLGYVGGATNGGVVFSMRNFWQMFPRGLDIRGLGGDQADVTVWAYSPNGEAMDMRHYDTVGHGLNLIYEDIADVEELCTPVGMSRSYEISLLAVYTTPTREYLGELGKVVSTPPQLVADPEFYQSQHLFGGRWAVPNTSTDALALLEKKQDDLLTFYINEVDQRKFYSFWDFGDVMHTYDTTRHTWRYDVGGYAWDNAELGTDLWLWFSFLRTGRADVFRMGYHLTRHVSEVDSYHTGKFAGLGSRHNVSHWGDGAKEARVSGSHLKRPMYYLTGGDETLGDMIRYALQVPQSLIEWEPLREILPSPTTSITPSPTRVRIGPDWTALVGSWFTEWERTGNSEYMEKIKTGMIDIGNFKNGLFTGYASAVGFFPDTSHLITEEDLSPSFTSAYDLMMFFGGAELLMEVVEIIDVPAFDDAWVTFCWLFSGTPAEQIAKYGVSWDSGGFYQLYAKELAYAGQRLGDQSLIQRAWDTFNTNTVGVWPNPTQVSGTDFITPVTEIVSVTTNDSASLSLAMFTLLAIDPTLAQPPLIGTEFASIQVIKPEPDEASEVSTIIGSGTVSAEKPQGLALSYRNTDLALSPSAVGFQYKERWAGGKTAEGAFTILPIAVDVQMALKNLIPVKPRAVDGIDFHWLEGTPTSNTHTSEFGAPWAQGQVYKSTSFALSTTDSSGKTSNVPLQSWPLAYWPDGSLKWSGHSIPPNAPIGDTYHLSVATPTEALDAVAVTKDSDTITVTTGAFTCVINSSSGSTSIISSLKLNGQSKGVDGKLILQLQDRPDDVGDTSPINTLTAIGQVETATVEQDGPVRAVVKITGSYYPQNSSRGALLPFTLRIVIGAGGTEARLVHVFILDDSIDIQKDFIKGLGFNFGIPLAENEPLWDRHVRFASADGGIWGEAANIISGLRRDPLAPVTSSQFNGTSCPATSTWPTSITPYLTSLPLWNDFSLNQLDADSFSIWKRTTSASKWLKHAAFGSRAAGLGYIGGAANGGVVFSMRNFWEMYPRSLDVRGLGGNQADVTLWGYSPAGDAMDLRHYDTVGHGLDLAYEDIVDPSVLSTPVGTSRSYEISLLAVYTTPTREYLGELGKVVSTPPQLVADPEFYQSQHLFGGRWAVPNTSTDALALLEKKQDDLLTFYVNEVEQRKFYSFWDFGDVMHTYDTIRHCWRYDVGGYAWDNAELGTDLWLWFSFLRTGRADVFRLAYHMTRHLTETDSYHTGKFAGLGSRHNVNHTGDGAKESRVSGSHLKRPMYYLSGGDETLGDMIRYSLHVPQSLIQWEPLREILPSPTTSNNPSPTRVRIGPDWTALVGDWFTEWERTGNSEYRDKIKTGMIDISGFPNGMFSGYTAAVGFFPETSHLVLEEDISPSFKDSYHLTMLFGGGELLMEVVEVIDVPQFDRVWIDFCWLFSGTDSEKIARYGVTFNSGGFYQLYAKLLAYAGQRLDDHSLIQRAWDTFNTNTVGVWPDPTSVSGTDYLRPVTEIVNLATNDSASLSLAMFTLLAIDPTLAQPPLIGTQLTSIQKQGYSFDTCSNLSTVVDSGSVYVEKRWKEREQTTIKQQRAFLRSVRRALCF